MANNSKKRVPSEVARPTTRKELLRETYESDQPKDRPMVWRFSSRAMSGPWGFQCISGESWALIISKLHHFESRKMGEIFAPGEQLGKFYEVEKLPREAQKELQRVEREDLTVIHRLRFAATSRLYGFVTGNVFHVLWWDPHHQVFPSNKKHT